MSASHSNPITLDSVMEKIAQFFSEFQSSEDISKFFSKALSDVRQYSNFGIPKDSNSDEYKIAIRLFGKINNNTPLTRIFLEDIVAIINVYDYMKEKNMDLFKTCLVGLPEVLHRIKIAMDDMVIDPDNMHQENYKKVKEFVVKFEDLVLKDILSLEKANVLVRKNPQPF